MRDLSSVGETGPEDGMDGYAVVWGNCQAAPVAALIDAPLASVGIEVVRTPPVFEMDASALAALQDHVLPRTAVLVSQPIRDEYRIAGCSTRQLAAQLPADSRLVTFPVVYDSSAFPFQVRGYQGDGSRIAAPLTDYHDLRAVVAAERGFTVERAVTWWPMPSVDLVRANAERSTAELRSREQPLDIHVTDLLSSSTPPMHTLTHPTNATLAAIARRVLAALGWAGDAPEVPTREFLGAIRAPVDPTVATALGYATGGGPDQWVIDKQAVPLARILEAQLDFYARHPDVVIDARTRFAERSPRLDG